MGMIRWICLGIFLCFLVSAQAQPIHIACIGNSITVGARVENPLTESYPAILGKLFAEHRDQHVQIRNFGIGGATMLRFGTPNVWRVLDSLRSFPAEVVIIEIGTNETVGAPRYNWEHIVELEKDYTDFIMEIRRLHPDVDIVVCSPLDMVLETPGLSKERLDNLIERRPRIWELRKRLKQLSREQHTFFLDLTRPFKGRADLMTSMDGVHPNKEGYAFLASTVYRFLQKHQLVNKRTESVN
jgi:acyl-CoA thioesterase I